MRGGGFIHQLPGGSHPGQAGSVTHGAASQTIARAAQSPGERAGGGPGGTPCTGTGPHCFSIGTAPIGGGGGAGEDSAHGQVFTP